MHNWRHVTGLGWGGDVNVHVNLRHTHNWRHVTGLGWGGDVNVHVNLRHMHNWRHVTGLGWGGDVNVHVNLRHTHSWRHVTGLGWGGDVNVHVNLRHMHNWRHVTGLWCTTDVMSLGWGGVGMLTFMLACWTRLKPSCTDTTQVITCGRNWESWPRRVDAEQLARVSWKRSFAEWLVVRCNWISPTKEKKQ